MASEICNQYAPDYVSPPGETLLERLGSEPYPHTYTEQDLHEQSRKMIIRYNQGLPATRNHIESSTTNTPKNHEEIRRRYSENSHMN